MMIKRCFWLFITLFWAQNGLFSQKSLSLDDVVPGGKNYYRYYPRQASGSFTAQGDLFIQMTGDSVFVWDKKGSKLFLTSTKTVRDALPASVKQSARISDIRWISPSSGWVNTGKCFYLVDVATKQVVDSVCMLSGGSNPDFDASAGVAAYTVGNDLFISSKGGAPVRVAHSIQEHHIFGQAVYRNEFGINKGTFWSPDAKKLAYYFMDESMVDDYPLVDISTRIAVAKPIKYPMAGLKSHQVKIGVYDVGRQTTIYLNTGEPADRFFTNIAWTPDGNNILVAEVNRDQNHMKMNLYDAITGNLIRTLFEETDQHWIEPSHPAVFLKNNPDRFVWQSKRDGYNHLYLYDINGRMLRQLTKGEWQVTQFYGFDKQERNLFVQSTQGGYLNRHIYRVSAKDGKTIRLSNEDGVHDALFSNDMSVWVDYFTSINIAARTSLINTATSNAKVLSEVVNPLNGFDLPEIKMVDIKSADGLFNLTGRVILPTDFDASKKYPVVVYVYGGPHSQMVTNSWLGGAQTWMFLLAQKGYIVFTMDNRGTDGHGKEFEQAIHRRLGECEMADQMEGIKYLKSLPYVDADRIGVNGWSYGGFMTTSLMLRHNDVFKVGVAGGPVIDWKMYEIMYGERYMDHPDENPDGYEKNNLCNYVTDLKGRLMLIHGDEDPVVVWQHSLRFLQEAVKNRVQLDYFVYPGHEHNVLGPDRVHLIGKIIRYFDDFL